MAYEQPGLNLEVTFVAFLLFRCEWNLSNLDVCIENEKQENQNANEQQNILGHRITSKIRDAILCENLQITVYCHMHNVMFPLASFRNCKK